jgi:hypothetical protein
LVGVTGGRVEQRGGQAATPSYANRPSLEHPLGGESFPGRLKTLAARPLRPDKRGRKKKETVKNESKKGLPPKFSILDFDKTLS